MLLHPGRQGHIDVLLHKASDELVRSQDGSGALTWSEAMQQLQRQLEGRPEICVVDPFMATAKVGAGLGAWGITREGRHGGGGGDFCHVLY